jgi:TrmH family RNA methyltransferase
MADLGLHNPKVGLIKKLGRSGRARREAGLFLLEGPKALAEAVSRGVGVVDVLFTSTAQADLSDTLEAAGRGGADLYEVTDKTLSAISQVQEAQGVVATAAIPSLPSLEDLAGGDVLAACGVQDPGNLGALVRVAAASSVGAVLADMASADPFAPKAVRGSAATVLQTPVGRVEDLGATLDALKALGMQIAATVPRGGQDPREADLGRNTVFLLGGEGGGLASDLVERGDLALTIPLDGDVESLNVTVAAALVCFEARRQKR